jgi:hypothetical protein
MWWRIKGWMIGLLQTCFRSGSFNSFAPKDGHLQIAKLEKLHGVILCNVQGC